jgi:hypothetical protein
MVAIRRGEVERAARAEWRQVLRTGTRNAAEAVAYLKTLLRAVAELEGWPAAERMGRWSGRAAEQERGGYLARRKNRESGTHILVQTAEQAGMLPDDGAWCTTCEEHGSIMHYETRTLAEQWAASPSGWCEGCRDGKAVAAKRAAIR